MRDDPLIQPDLAREAQIQTVARRSATGITRQITDGADCRKAESLWERALSRSSPDELIDAPGEAGPIIPDIIEVPVVTIHPDVEWPG